MGFANIISLFARLIATSSTRKRSNHAVCTFEVTIPWIDGNFSRRKGNPRPGYAKRLNYWARGHINRLPTSSWGMQLVSTNDKKLARNKGCKMSARNMKFCVGSDRVLNLFKQMIFTTFLVDDLTFGITVQTSWTISGRSEKILIIFFENRYPLRELHSLVSYAL